MENMLLKKQLIMFIVMVIVGMLFNPMNILAYRFSDIYISLTLFYGGLLMASNMIWSHEIIHYLHMGKCNLYVFLIGIVLSVSVSYFLLRDQFMIEDKQWLKRMISHHSTALTTTTKLLENNDNFKDNPNLYRLAKDIVYNQKREIIFMKSML
tara:strand:- start:16042 stop:16500 length:459 start_codon:yes stop_codon:yes gene_type:complete